MKNLKLFAVDDDPYYLLLLEQYLKNIGCENLSTFKDGISCINQLNQKPDVVFLDYNMDNLSGYDVLKKIKRYDPNIFVVMLSGQDDLKSAVNTLKFGAFDYLQKGDHEERKIFIILQKVLEVKELLAVNKPSFLKKLFHFF